MGLSLSKIGKAGKLEKQSKLKIDHNGMGERRIAGSYKAIRKSVMSAGERGIERVDTGEISLVGEMAERMKELAINGLVERENAGERMVGVGLKGIKKDTKIRQGLVREAKKITGDIKSEGVIRERSRQQDGAGIRWAKEDNEGKQVLVKGKEIQNRIKGGKKFGSAGKEIMIQGERGTKEQEVEFEGMRKYGSSGHKQMKRITEGERRVIVGQGEEQNRIYEARKLATGGTERVMQVKQRIKEQSRAREDMREKEQHRIQRVNEEKEGLHEGNEGERRIFLGEIGIENEELGNYERAKARIKNLDTLQEVSGEGIVEVQEGERGVAGVHRKVQGEIRKRNRASSKGIEKDRVKDE